MIPTDVALFIVTGCVVLLFFLLNREINRRRKAEADLRALYSRTWGAIRMNAIKALPDEWDRRHPDPAVCSDELRKLVYFEPATPGDYGETDPPPP